MLIQKRTLKLVMPLIASSAVLASVLSVSSTARATTSYAELENHNSLLCMGVTAGILQPGQRIIQWPCNGNADQFWSQVPNESFQQIRNFKDSNYCLAVQDGTEGTQLVVEPCNSGDWRQFWWLTPLIVGGTSVVTIESEDSYIAAVSVASFADGASIIQWEDEIVNGSHFEQQWIW